MESLPSISKVYSMMLKVEKQRATHMMNTKSLEIIAFMEKSHIFSNISGQEGRGIPQTKPGYNVGNSYTNTKGISVRKGTYMRIEDAIRDKEHQYCEHCRMTGHTMGNCFKIHRYPD